MVPKGTKALTQAQNVAHGRSTQRRSYAALSDMTHANDSLWVPCQESSSSGWVIARLAMVIPERNLCSPRSPGPQVTAGWGQMVV